MRKYRTLSRFRCTAATVRPIVGLGTGIEVMEAAKDALELDFI